MPSASPVGIDQLGLYLGELRMGRLLYRRVDRAFAVEVTPEFLASGHDIAPIIYPHLDVFREGIVEYRGEPKATSPFIAGLPGFIVDSLPDRWGQLLADREAPGKEWTIMDSLASIGAGGPGAIAFRVPGAPEVGSSEPVPENLAGLAALAERIKRSLPDKGRIRTGSLSTGGTLGGVFPKVGAHLPAKICKGGVVRAERLLVGGLPPAGHVPGIVKFSPIPDDETQGAVEYAFHTMACAAGLHLPPACLLEDDKGGRHFAVERFDRIVRPDGSVGRIHAQSLSALLHRDAVGAIRYEDLIVLASQLGGPKEALEAFRRVVFNLLATNRDDHGRNHAFLYDASRRSWSLAPAYDLNPSLGETLTAIRWGSGGEIPRRFGEVLELAASGGISEAEAVEVFEQVESAVAQWPKHARASGVSPEAAGAWGEGILSAAKQGGPLRTDAKAFIASRRGTRSVS